jgi:hypothetical protein
MGQAVKTCSDCASRHVYNMNCEACVARHYADTAGIRKAQIRAFVARTRGERERERKAFQ